MIHYKQQNTQWWLLKATVQKTNNTKQLLLTPQKTGFIVEHLNVHKINVQHMTLLHGNTAPVKGCLLSYDFNSIVICFPTCLWPLLLSISFSP